MASHYEFLRSTAVARAPAISDYIGLMAKDRKLFQNYVEKVRFKKAVAFMDRFPEWSANKHDRGAMEILSALADQIEARFQKAQR